MGEGDVRNAGLDQAICTSPSRVANGGSAIAVAVLQD